MVCIKLCLKYYSSVNIQVFNIKFAKSICHFLVAHGVSRDVDLPFCGYNIDYYYYSWKNRLFCWTDKFSRFAHVTDVTRNNGGSVGTWNTVRQWGGLFPGIPGNSSIGSNKLFFHFVQITMSENPSTSISLKYTALKLD